MGKVDLVVDVEVEEGVYALRAARICAGVTVGAGVSSGLFPSVGVGEGREEADAITARSIAPLRTSNKLRTSPVRAATFFVRSINVGAGKNFFTSAAIFPSSSFSVRDLRRN